jgi:dynein heavy chain, axonemal
LAVLKEVKYLGLLKVDKIPPEAITIHEQNNQYRKFITSLDYTVDSYNKIIKNASPEEEPLIENEMKDIDTELENGEKNLKWKSPNIDEYINNIRLKVSDLETRLQKSKSNLEKIKQLMKTWQGNPLFKRYEQKSTLLQLDDKQVRLDNRYKEIKETGNKIIDLIKENKSLLKVEDENSDMWKVYTEYADKIIVDGFHKIIQTSLIYFLKETDYVRSNPDPLFEAQFQLKPPEMRFNPSLNYNESDGFYEQIEGLIGNVYKQASLMTRVAQQKSQTDYKVIKLC